MTSVGIAAGRSSAARSAILPAFFAAALILTAVLPRSGSASTSQSTCRPTVDQLAEPRTLPLGAEVTVTLRLSLDCQAARMPLGMALVIDRSSSMLRADAIGKAREGALGLIDHLRPGADWGTLVTFNETARVDQTLTDVPALLRRAVRDLQAGGDTNISAGLAEGHKQLRRLADRSTLRALVLLTDGKNESGAAAVTREAEALRQAGIYVAAVGLGRDPERAILEAAATSPSDAWFPQDPAELPAIFQRIGERWIGLQVREAAVRDSLPLDLVASAPALPPGRQAPGGAWYWDLPAAGLLPIDIRLRLRPTRTGRQPVSSGALLTWRDQAGLSGEAPFPIPFIEVFAPEAWPTALASATAGAVPEPSLTPTTWVTPTSVPSATVRHPATVPHPAVVTIHLPMLSLRGEAPTLLAGSVAAAPASGASDR
ncbi:MAG TPA: vWA domain-containing protein [Anaerolineae bacterium]|nr:vWA domain-containing protein [Anaerolineae bacterium]